MIRIAAAGDLHLGTESEGSYRPLISHVHERADILLLAGDLTQHGTPAEFRILAGELEGLAIPVAAVFGNHDYHRDAQDENRALLEDVGVTVIEGESLALDLPTGRLGVAGVKGFCGGFAGACGAEFGEPEMKAFIRKTKHDAERFAAALAEIESCDVRVAVTHYSPIKGTLVGEKLEIYPFMGSYLLAEAIDGAEVDLALHGHAHKGTSQGVTPGGVPVRNVAMPVIRAGYHLFSFNRIPEGRSETPARAG